MAEHSNSQFRRVGHPFSCRSGYVPIHTGPSRLGLYSPHGFPIEWAGVHPSGLDETRARHLVVRSLHNGTDIAFRLDWKDHTKNVKVTAGSYRDGVAIGFPIGEAPPFFCMGQLDQYINIWHWKADWENDIEQREARKQRRIEGGPREPWNPIPRRPSSVEELIGGGFSTLTTKKGQGKVKGKASWDRGEWRVVMTRKLCAADPANDARLVPGILQAATFGGWNGESHEINGQKAVSPWFQIHIDPA